MQVANSIQELIDEEIKELKDEIQRKNEKIEIMKKDNFKMHKIIEELLKNQK